MQTLKSSSVLEISFPDDNRELEPPDSISNSEVKRLIADGSVGLPHVRVGHRQDLIQKASSESLGLFLQMRVAHQDLGSTFSFAWIFSLPNAPF